MHVMLRRHTCARAHAHAYACHTQEKHTHTHNHRVGKCQLCLLSPEVQCRMRLHFYSEHCALSPSVILVMCV